MAKGFFACLQRKFKCQEEIDALSYNAKLWDLVIKKWGTLDEMVKNGTALKSSTSALQAKIPAQFGKNLKQLGSPDFKMSTDIFLMTLGNGDVRAPKAFIKDILRYTPQDMWKYKTDQSWFVCSDFATALWGELNNSPWWGLMFGIAIFSEHQVNWFWPSDSEDIIFIEPQNDGMMATYKNKKPFLMVK